MMTHQWTKRIGRLAVLGIGILTGCASDKPDVGDIFKSYQGDLPGVAVMVIDNGEVVLDTTFGLADIANSTPVTRTTNFRLASVTKQFTAMCILILKERGQLEFTTTLDKIFPKFPKYGGKITIRHLLQHTSGLVAYESLMPDTVNTQVYDRDVLNMMMGQDTTYFEPGSDFRYSNSGYAVLAMVVESIGGKSFAGFLQEEIFQPLGMTNTVAFEDGISEVTNRAFGYTVHADSVSFTDQSPTSAVLGDGGIYSSIAELYKWDQALYGQQLVSAGLLQQAFTPALKNYGFGWRIDSYQGLLRMHHTGGTRGFRTVIQRFPENGFSVIILSNRNNSEVAPLADKLADLYLEQQKR